MGGLLDTQRAVKSLLDSGRTAHCHSVKFVPVCTDDLIGHLAYFRAGGDGRWLCAGLEEDLELDLDMHPEFIPVSL